MDTIMRPDMCLLYVRGEIYNAALMLPHMWGTLRDGHLSAWKLCLHDVLWRLWCWGLLEFGPVDAVVGEIVQLVVAQ